MKFHERKNAKFLAISPLSEDSVRTNVSKSPFTSCALNPIPMWLLVCLNELIPIITKIVNHSIVQGCFPNSLKHANITLLTKKPGLDHETLKKISTCRKSQVLAKTVQRACSSQIQEYMTENNLNGKVQSA